MTKPNPPIPAVPPPPLLGVSRVCPGPWRLRWLHSINANWNVTRYDAIWEEGGERVGSAEVDVLSTEQEAYEVVLSGLNLTSEYAIRVRGVNRDGPGNYSDVLVYQPQLCGESTSPSQPLSSPPQPLSSPPQPLSSPPQPLSSPPQPLSSPPQPLSSTPALLVSFHFLHMYTVCS